MGRLAATLIGAWAAAVLTAVVLYAVWLMSTFDDSADTPSQTRWIVAYLLSVTAAALVGGVIGYRTVRTTRPSRPD